MAALKPAGLHLTNQHVVVFVDETGHDRFHDDQHPVFGWAGCAMTVPVYARVSTAWRTLKADHFPGVGVFHSAAIRKTSAQQAALQSFCQAHPFARLAAVARRDTRFEHPADAVDPVLNAVGAGLLKRIEKVLCHMEFSRVAVVFESGESWEGKVQRVFGRTTIRENGRELPMEAGFMDKALAEPGLEIADYVAYVAGRAVRENDRTRREFQAVFGARVPKHLKEFMHILSASQQRQATLRRRRWRWLVAGGLAVAAIVSAVLLW